MKPEEILNDKSLSNKQITELLSELLRKNEIIADDLVEATKLLKDVPKANCLEALEHASGINPEIITEKCFVFAIESLPAKAPRVKWEAARVIANSARIHPAMLENAANNLLANTEHPGTVVRWSAAIALSSIVCQKTGLNQELVPALKVISEREEKNSIKKIYNAAFKKIL
jgi:hypothetical protein